MRKNWKNKLAQAAVIVLLIVLASCNKGHDHADHADVYTCPMHPTVTSNKPGTCPVCGMDLVRKARPGEDLKLTEDLSRLTKSPNQAVVSSIKTVKPEYKGIPVSTEAVGVVTYDTRKVYTIPSRVAGRVEKMFVKYEFELLYLLENDQTNETLVAGAKRRLELLGVSSSQLNDLIEKKQPMQIFAIYSPYDGYAIINDTPPTVTASLSPVPASPSADAMGGMGASSAGQLSPNTAKSMTSSTGFIREGNYVSAGQTLIKLVNTNALRIELSLPVSQTELINKGDKVDLKFGNDGRVRASVDFVQPFLNEGQNFLKVRVYIPHGKDNYIGQFVQATIELPSKEALWVPRQAVLQLGTDQVVFVKEGDILKPKRVVTGISTAEYVEIKRGLASADEIASNAQYLVDSESFIKPAN
jgi:Cu(I)/Ag(I) efflux system membrane fusion protein